MCDVSAVQGRLSGIITAAELDSLSHWWLKTFRTTVCSSLLANCLAEDQLKGRGESWCYYFSLSFLKRNTEKCPTGHPARRATSLHRRDCPGRARSVEPGGSFCNIPVPALCPRKLDFLVKHWIPPFTYKAITCCLVAFRGTDNRKL